MKPNTSEIPDIVLDDLKRTIEEAIFPNRVFLFVTEEKLSINYKDEHSQEEMVRLNEVVTNTVRDYFAKKGQEIWE